MVLTFGVQPPPPPTCLWNIFEMPEDHIPVHFDKFPGPVHFGMYIQGPWLRTCASVALCLFILGH